MNARIDYQPALEEFLASGTFDTVVHAGLAQWPICQSVVALHLDGPFTVFSQSSDVPADPNMLLMTIPSGGPRSVRAGLRQMLVRPELPLE